MAKLTAIELFSGVGGMSLGFEQAGFDLVVAIEKDPIHAALHSRNFPSCKTIRGDVSKLSGSDLRTAAGLTADAPVHVLFGGPPCQGFSFGGKKRPSDPRNIGVLEFARLVEELRPMYFVMENVDGLLAPVAAPIVSMFLGVIHSSGYEIVTPVQALDAADYGVPQRRKRVFFIGYRKGLVAPKYPQPKPFKVTVLDALGDLPQLGEYDELYGCGTIRVKLKSAASSYALRLRDAEQPVDEYPLSACLLTVHEAKVRRRFAKLEPGEREPVSRFFKLDAAAQATTLRAGTDISRGRFTAPRPIHHLEDRCITVREAARLHSFPDWFEFHETIWHGFRQVGNAVPPLLAAAVAGEVARVLKRTTSAKGRTLTRRSLRTVAR